MIDKKKRVMFFIVILLVINLILIKVIISTASNKKGSYINDVAEHIKNVQLEITKDIYTKKPLDLTIHDVDNGSIDNSLLLDDDKVKCEKYTVVEGKLVGATNCAMTNWKSSYNYTTDKKVYLADGKDIQVEKTLYKDDILNGADPVYSDNLIPVIINADGTVTKADIYKKWYDYTNKEWANAVILKDGVKVEDNISLDDIESYFVWIPRYKYKLFNVGFNDSTAETIDIVFENKDTEKSVGTENGEYLTHKAFTLGEEELNGIWVGKFETTGTIDNITIRPNAESIVSQTLNTVFRTSYNYKRDDDSHMMKNTEWGAVSYLSMSAYGINDEIRINNTSDHKTGYGANTPNATSVLSTTDTVGDYKSEYGILASTTGNITGIYDMSGGAWEVMAAYRTNGNGVNGTNRSELNINEFDSKYFDVYTSNTTNVYTNTILGDATGETHGWFSDRTNYISYNGPWFLRSGYWRHGADAGAFYYGGDVGAADSRIGFRIVLTK